MVVHGEGQAIATRRELRSRTCRCGADRALGVVLSRTLRQLSRLGNVPSVRRATRDDQKGDATAILSLWVNDNQRMHPGTPVPVAACKAQVLSHPSLSLESPPCRQSGLDQIATQVIWGLVRRLEDSGHHCAYERQQQHLWIFVLDCIGRPTTRWRQAQLNDCECRHVR